MKPVKIDDYQFLEGAFQVGDRRYSVQDLVKASEGLEVFDMPLVGLHLLHPICQNNLKSFLYHYKRVDNADLQYPVIIDDCGYICDGWHRVAKAILLGHTTIKAKRLIVMPEPEITK